MGIKRFLIAIMLLLFGAVTVHAAALGVAMQLPAAPDAAVVVHCHDAGAGDDATAHPHPGTVCASCAACLPLLTAPAVLVLALPAHPALHPHSEASYFTFVGTPPHRPPISA